MSERNTGFRLRLNLFDCIVIVIILLAGAALLWNRLRPAAAPAGPQAETMRYTIRLEGVVAGTGGQVHPGGALEDTQKNLALGQVVSSETKPAQKSLLDEVNHRYVTATKEGYEDVYILVESPATVGEDAVLLTSGYKVRVGEDAYVRGPGFTGVGKIYSIERGR